ncbi:hypothetical protein MASR2M48_18990 [Spirochaetota bacterium]
MRYFALKEGEDPEYWGLVGLLHDIDYQSHPEEHLKHAGRMLEAGGYPVRPSYDPSSAMVGACVPI